MVLLKDSKYLEGPVSKLGFSDNLGRYHWISKRDLSRIRKTYGEEKKKGFPA
jgi:hypothetical protein